MSAVFAQWQPRYADHNIATFPVTPDKVPAVKGHLRVGLNASDQLAMKFPANDAFGLACRRNRTTVLDVNTRDERALADGLARHGQTPFIVRSGSGNFQAWYRHGGEKSVVSALILKSQSTFSAMASSSPRHRSGPMVPIS